MTDKPASPAQLAYLADLVKPERISALSSAEARYLIRFLLGPPPNASRAQQLFLLGLLERLPRDELRHLIADLAEQEQQTKAGEGSQEARPATPARPATAAPEGAPSVTRERWTPSGQRPMHADPPSPPATADELPPGVDLDEVF